MRYEAGVGRHSGANFAEFQSNHVQQAAAIIGRAYVPGGPSPSAKPWPVLRLLGEAFQLVLPVLFLVTLSIVAFLYGDSAVPGFGAAWLTPGHLMVPLTFFCIALTNRRYGAGAALAQTLICWILATLAVLLDPADIAAISGRPLPELHSLFGFGGGLLAGQLFSIAVFDMTRGPRWFVAPLLALIFGGLMFVLIALPVTVPGAAVNGALSLYAGIIAASAVVLLVPYWMLRGLVPPQSGFGGY